MCELEWNTALLTTALINGADISMPAFEPQKVILNSHHDII